MELQAMKCPLMATLNFNNQEVKKDDFSDFFTNENYSETVLLGGNPNSQNFCDIFNNSDDLSVCSLMNSPNVLSGYYQDVDFDKDDEELWKDGGWLSRPNHNYGVFQLKDE